MGFYLNKFISTRRLLKSIKMSIARSLTSLLPKVEPAICSVVSRNYHAKVIDHYENPRNVGTLDKKSKTVGTGLVGAPACGDVMRLQIEVDDDGKIVDAKFKTFGCGSAIASSSLATEWIKGMSIGTAKEVKNTEIAKELCLPPVKLHCSMLAEDAIKAAITNYYSKNPNARSTDLGGTGSSMPKIDVETVMQPAASQTATV